MATLEEKMQELSRMIISLNAEIKTPADDSIQDALEMIYELLGILVERYPEPRRVTTTGRL